MEKELSISGLYYRYKKVSDEKIQNLLTKIKIVKKEHKGVGSTFGYYPLNKESIKKISAKPRNVSLTFDATETENKPIEDLLESLTITFLVKSTSRFFLKPDVGEIFDQIKYDDLNDVRLKAICLNEGYETLDDTEGEHFLMTATLLKESIHK